MDLPYLVRRLYRRLIPKTIDQTHNWFDSGVAYADQWIARTDQPLDARSDQPKSTLEQFFDARDQGPGIWKWRHYFDIYHRHFNHLRNRENLVILEIGIYSGGSLEMWRDYFGPAARIYGVDIEPACRSYERPGTHVLIGDQADPTFWRRVLSDGSLPPPDIVIDDGGHTPLQQRVTLEELLPVIRPGGVYICEDIHKRNNSFASFVNGLADSFNAMEKSSYDMNDPERRSTVEVNTVQGHINSIQLYPFVVVIEKRFKPLDELVAPKHGTQWEPFLA